MQCPNCGDQKVKALIYVQMQIDADDNYHLTKKVLRKQSTELVSQSHERTSYVCQKCGWVCGYPYDGGSLKSEEARLLKLEELQSMAGDKIYIHYIGSCEGFYPDEEAPYFGKYEQYIHEYNGMLRACDLPLRYYNQSWIAYDRAPNNLIT